MNKQKLVIIGGGLTGLTINYLVKRNKLLSEKYEATIIEGRSRLGGRIHTVAKEKKSNTLEMGATWFGLKHTRFLNLLNTLEIKYFEQIIGEKAHYEPLSTSPPYLVKLPPNPEPSMRVQGGTSSIINKLAEHLQKEEYRLEETVMSLIHEKAAVTVKTNKTEYTANMVISTLPPFLFNKTISVTPSLDQSLTNISGSTHTWMGESIKIALTFKEPFWRNNNGSGTVFSNVGPIPEMYDHCNYKDDFYALKGFFNGNYFSLTKEERLNKVLDQLQKYFGGKVRKYISYEEAIWRNEPLTFLPYESHILPHQNNGHAVYQKAYLKNCLYVAGTETATQYPGYMEGAVRSAEHVISEILKQ